MTLDPSAREANIRDSIKKFFVDALHPAYPLTFDKSMASPRLQGQNLDLDKWVGINFDFMDMGVMSELYLHVFCCTRRDNEGFKLAQLRDTVVGLLSDTNQTDGMKRITFYRSYQDKAWEVIGALLVQEVSESGQVDAPDETKYKILTVKLRWSAKI